MTPQPPDTLVAPVVDEFHGRTITDPYRWLEDAESPETARWVAAQNAHTRALLDTVPGREEIRRRLAGLLSIGMVSAPVQRGRRYFYLRREGEQNQPVLWLRDENDGSERMLLDPNTASSEGTIALDWWYPSWDGCLLAYGYSQDGNEWSTLFVLDVESGELRSDRIPRTRYASVAWLPDSSGFYYTRYPPAGAVPEGQEQYNQHVYFHVLGSDPAADPVVFADNEPEEMLSVALSPDGRYLTVQIMRGWDRSRVLLRDVESGEEFQRITPDVPALFYAHVAGGELFLLTNHEAPRFRLLAVPADTPLGLQREVIPQTEDILQGVTFAGQRIIASYLHNAASRLVMYQPDGSVMGEVPLPEVGTVVAITGEWDVPGAFFAFESFAFPPAVYLLPPGTERPVLWAHVQAPIQLDHYRVWQEWYTSRDGVRVSMFLVAHRDLDRSHPHPTLLTGYGGFNVNRTPAFQRSLYLWLDHGGIFALPQLRGGGEYGEEWHQAGMLERKQNVFNDFIAAAEYLIGAGYTDSGHLAISGGSNGGLLVGAALTQRPDLFRAVVCQVPLLDMLRYHQFLIARLWIPEYGSAENPEQFPYLLAYSPYHQVRHGERYPAVLFTTAESDSRVDPLHARKMTALLQAATASEHPVLLRVEERAGHGAGKPLAKVLEEQTDFWSFIFWQLGVPVK